MHDERNEIAAKIVFVVFLGVYDLLRIMHFRLIL